MPYDDIINLPHHVSTVHPQMPRENRAAQFSPFAALTGYDAAVIETARYTEQKMELSEDAITELNVKLNILADMVDLQPEVAITHFRQDKKKDGGAYITTTGVVKRVDGYEQAIVLVSGMKIGISNIVDLDTEIFNELL